MLCLVLLACVVLFAQAQKGHYRGELLVGAVGGISGHGNPLGVSGTYFLKRKLALNMQGGLENTKQLAVEMSSVWTDLGIDYTLIGRTKTFVHARTGLAFARDAVTNIEALEDETKFKTGIFYGVKLEQNIFEGVYLTAQFNQKAFTSKEFGKQRYALLLGFNYKLQ
jgi:hypothetical protein